LSEASGLRLNRRWQELVDACSLRVERRWLVAVEPSGLGLERCPWWVCERAAVAEALLEALLTEAGLHRLLEAGRLGLLEWREPILLWLESCWLRNKTILLKVVEAGVLLREASHLLLHSLHVHRVLLVVHALSRRCHLGHVGVVASQLGHESWRGPEGTVLLRVLWGRRRPLGRRCDEATRP